MSVSALFDAEDRRRAAVFEQDWRKRRLAHRLQNLGWLLLVSALLAVSLELSELRNSSVGLGWGERVATFVDRMTPHLRADALFASRNTDGSLASWFYDLPLWLAAIRETVAMAIVGTLVGGVFALSLSFLAASNLNANRPLRVLVRRSLDAARTIPDVILALIFAAAFSLGPVAGVLTLIVSTTGSLGKLFSECMENARIREVEAIAATGGNWLLQMRFGVIPQLLPQLVSYWLLRLELNLSAAAALGIVGAGGIGVELQRAISFTEFDTYLAILLLIIACITVIDLVSERLRHRLIGAMA